MPKVSVIIPCYNHGQYIDEAVDSILNQTSQDVEIIIVNDGSTDPFTVEKLRAYHKPKTSIIHTDNRGPSAARNTGIKAAAGEHILTLDADDWFEPTFLEKAVAILAQHPTVGVVTCGLQDFGISTKKHLLLGGDVKNFLVRGSVIGSVLFRKLCWEQANGYDECMREASYGAEDWNFILDITKRGWTVHVIEEYLLHYRRHPISRKTICDQNRPELFRYIVSNHREVYQQYVEDVLFAKEEKIFSLRKEMLKLSNSLDYRIGHFLLKPFRFLYNFFSRKSNI